MRSLERRLLALAGVAALIAAWSAAVALSGTELVPSPLAVARGIAELARSGLLVRYEVASLFRVTWGFVAAALVAIPLGLGLGVSPRAARALGPLLEILRPISPLAWIPIAILWLGVGDAPAIFIIFLGSSLPLTVATLDATRSVSLTHVQVARNFGLGRRETIRRVIFPAVLPQIVGALRLTLGIAWLVVVAAEMIAVNSGLGFLVIDARNAGNRYDLVVAGMALMGVTGLVLDAAIARLERLPAVRWAYAGERRT